MEVNEALIDRLAILSRLYFNEEEKKETRNALLLRALKTLILIIN